MTTQEYFAKLLEKGISRLKVYGNEPETIIKVQCDSQGGLTIFGLKDGYYRYLLTRDLCQHGEKFSPPANRHELYVANLNDNYYEWNFTCEKPEEEDE